MKRLGCVKPVKLTAGKHNRGSLLPGQVIELPDDTAKDLARDPRIVDLTPRPLHSAVQDAFPRKP